MSTAGKKEELAEEQAGLWWWWEKDMQKQAAGCGGKQEDCGHLWHSLQWFWQWLSAAWGVLGGGRGGQEP